MSLNITPEHTTMAFRDVLLANEHLFGVLTEAEVPHLEAQVDFDLTDRRGLGSFGDVYMGQYKGAVSEWYDLPGWSMLNLHPQSVCVKIACAHLKLGSVQGGERHP